MLFTGFIVLVSFATSLWAISLKQVDSRSYSLISPGGFKVFKPHKVIYETSPPISINSLFPSSNSQTPTTPESVSGVNQLSSANWAGYIATGGVYSSVSANWTVPNPTNSAGVSTDATWVGIGGVTTNDLIQIGTQNIVGKNSNITTTAFYETLPNVSQTINNFTIAPGDNVSASVAEVSPDLWKLSIVNNSNSESFSTTVYYNSSLSSAEWIEEDPSDSQGLIPLDNFGQVSFSNCQTTNNGQAENLATSDAQAISMTSPNGQNLADVTNSSNSGFTVSESNSQQPYSGIINDRRAVVRRTNPLAFSFYFSF